MRIHFCEGYINPEFEKADSATTPTPTQKWRGNFQKPKVISKIGHFEAFVSENCIIYTLSMAQDSFSSTFQVDSSEDIVEWKTSTDHYFTS